MNKTMKLFIFILIMILSITPTILIIGYERENINSKELSFSEEFEHNTFNIPDIQLNNIEIVIIFISILTFVIMLVNIILFLLPTVYIVPKWRLRLFLMIISLLIGFFLSWIVIYITNKYILISHNDSSNKHYYQSYIVRPVGTLEIDDDANISYKTYYGNDTDINTILIKSDNQVSLSNVTIHKRGNSSNVVSARTYGTNAGLLVLKDSALNLKNSTIETHATGATGIFATLDGSIINADMTTIETTGTESIGMSASLNGRINASNIKIKTSLSSSPAISSLRNGSVSVSGAIIETNAQNSAIFQTSGEVNIDTSTGDANASLIAYVDGNGKVKISNSQLKAAGIKGTEDSNDAGILIRKNVFNSNYKESANVNIYKSLLEIKKQSRVYSKAPMFVVQNNNAIINIEDTNFIYGSSNFLTTINNTRNTDKPMLVVLNATNQKIDGNIVTDRGTSLEINLSKSNLKGTINNKNEMKKITLYMTEDSLLELTGDSYITTIEDVDLSYSNIISNGYTLYYDKDLNKNLKGVTINLSDGGYIKGI